MYKAEDSAEGESEPGHGEAYVDTYHTNARMSWSDSFNTGIAKIAPDLKVIQVFAGLHTVLPEVSRLPPPSDLLLHTLMLYYS